MMRRRFSFVSLLFVVALAFGAALLAFWIGDDTLPRTISRITVLNNPVTPGEMLRMEFEGDAIRNCPATVNEHIADGKNLVAPVEERLGRINRKTGHFKALIEVPTSPTAAEGHATYMSDAEYVCNPWQRWFPLRVHREVPFEFGPSPLSLLMSWPRAIARAGDDW